MLYAEFKSSLFSIIPGAGMANLIYLGMILWLIALYSSSRKSAFFILLVVAGVFKGIDYLFLGHSLTSVLNEYVHMILIPLILTLLKGRAS